jgi:phosphoadenosine phosphosulfate reductase
MRNQRWCCKYVKEAGGFGRIVITGVRRDESTTRKNYSDIRAYIKSKKEQKIMIYPIANFSEYDVWQYIRENNLPYCSLYDEGFDRLGCVLCPFNNDIERQVNRFPKIANLLIRACNRLVEIEHKRGYMIFKNGNDKFNKWVSRK